MAIKIGLIGCGGHGRDRLSKILFNMESKVQLVACSDLDNASATSTATEHGYSNSYENYMDMLEKEDLDAVVVALPHDLLKSAGKSVLEAGLDLFVEKPAGVNADEILEIIEAEIETKKTVMVGYCMRYNPSRMRLKALFDKNIVGNAIQIHGHKSGSQLGTWNAYLERGGGQLRWHGVHIVDQVLWILGDRQPIRVHCETQWDKVLGSDQDSAFTILFDDGITASISVSSRTETIFDVIEVFGTDGRIRSEWPSEILDIQSSRISDYQNPTRIVPNSPDYMRMYTIQMNDWIDSLIKGVEMPIGSLDALNVYRVIDAAYKSAEAGEPINL